MEHKKKPRLELLLESDYETESETNSETSSSSNSSLDSSLVRSSSLPSLTSFAAPSTSLDIPPPAAAKVSSLMTSNVFPFKNPNMLPFSNLNTPSTGVPKASQTVTSKLPPPTASNGSSFVKHNVPPFSVPPSSIPNLAPTTSSVSTSPFTNISSSACSVLPHDSSGAAHDGEELRSSFRSACEEINHDLDIIMQPMKTKQETLKAIEDYLVVLSKKAKQPFKVDLTDDSYSTKVSLKVDKNKVIVFSQNTPKQEGEDSQQSEGAASNVPGPSCVPPAQNTGGAYWMPPVNPFTSSVTLRQHLEAASSNIRPRRLRPPPGFHPTPQYNVTNLGASVSGVEGQSSSSGVVRPPPGFHGIAGSAISSGPGIGSSNVAVPGPSTSSIQGYYGLLDTQAIIADLYRQSLSVVRQSAVLATTPTSTNNPYAATNPEQLLYSMVPRQMPESERRPSSQPQNISQGYHGDPPTTTSAHYGYGQSQVSMQNTPGPHGNELWQHFTNAAAASGSSYISGGGAGYWDDFLQKEVYDNITSDQNSDLWKQFEEYQRIHYAPGSLRTGSTIFFSENTGPSKHGPVGHCRPRSQPQGRSRPIENISIQRNIQQQSSPPRHPPHLGCGQMLGQPSSQEVLTLSERFKNASISNPSNARSSRNEMPQNRNALLGALLHKRLKERAANIFSGNNAASNVNNSPNPGRIITNSINITTNTNTNNSASLMSMAVEQLPCSYCIQNNKAAGNPTHVLRDRHGRTVCPILRNKPCPICNQAGDNAHTVHDCPIRKQWDMDDENEKAAKKST